MRVLLVFLLLAGLSVIAVFSLQQRSIARQTQYDSLIQPVAAQLEIDPLLVRALIWRESRFQPNVRGLNKERGLMQVTPGVAAEWAQVTKSPPIDLDSLFIPATNIEIGCWYLARTIHHWQDTDNPAAFEQNISFPTTRRYVDAILQKYADYQRGYFRPPWLSWWDRVTKRSDAPTLIRVNP